MLAIIDNDLYKYLALAVMLLAVLFGYYKGRNTVSVSSQSLAWTYVPLIALAIASLGPSALAILMYLGYKFGLLQPDPSGYHFSILIQDMPLEFAVINWPFVALYLTCRLWPNFGSARSAMWVSVVAMSLPNVLLFAVAPEMLSNVRDAGQGIGVIEAMLIFPIIAMILGNPFPNISDEVFAIIFALTEPIPMLGLSGWLVGWMAGEMKKSHMVPKRGAGRRI